MAATLDQSANDEWMQEAIGGRAERDPTLPDRACGYCRYCWALAAEIAGPAGKPQMAASASSDATKTQTLILE